MLGNYVSRAASLASAFPHASRLTLTTQLSSGFRYPAHSFSSSSTRSSPGLSAMSHHLFTSSCNAFSLYPTATATTLTSSPPSLSSSFFSAASTPASGSGLGSSSLSSLSSMSCAAFSSSSNISFSGDRAALADFLESSEELISSASVHTTPLDSLGKMTELPSEPKYFFRAPSTELKYLLRVVPEPTMVMHAQIPPPSSSSSSSASSPLASSLLLNPLSAHVSRMDHRLREDEEQGVAGGYLHYEDDNGLLMSSVLKKRRKMMNKHKLKKRRKAERHKIRKSTKE